MAIEDTATYRVFVTVEVEADSRDDARRIVDEAAGQLYALPGSKIISAYTTSAHRPRS